MATFIASMAFGWVIVLSSAAILLSIVAAWLSSIKNDASLPPGPRGFPFLGNLFLLKKNPAVQLTKWTKQFGSIFTIRGKNDDLLIILSDIDVARRVFSNEAVTVRPTGQVRSTKTDMPPGTGLFQSNGEVWKAHRRFALSTLRDLAINGNWLEDSILDDVEEFCAWLKSTGQNPVDPKLHLMMCSANVICAFLLGQRFSWNDPKFRRLSGYIMHNVATLKLQPILRAFPFLLWFPNAIRSRVMRFRQNRRELADFMKEILAEAKKKDLHPADVKDYVQAYLVEKEIGAKTSAKELFDEPQLIAVLLDMFSAGTETTASSIAWTLIFLIENPDVLDKIHLEIDSNVGREKLIRGSDREKLPFTEATILEVHRLASLVPVYGANASEDIEISGYTIPKGALIEVNLYGVHRDPRWWTNPKIFDPTRFLDGEGKIKKRDGYAPFGLGKRDCLAQVLARAELFLLIANILRCYSFKIPPGKTLTRENYISISLDFLIPAPFELIFVPRL